MIDVLNLRIGDAAGRAVLEDLSLAAREGSALGVVGESGSGKTTLALALLGHLRAGLRVTKGVVRTLGTDVFAASPATRRELRHHHVAYLGQDPAGALTPTMRVGALIAERLGSRDLDAVGEALEALQLAGDREFQRRFPHELSGGQQQRLALARALAGEPQLLVLDEPTTSLDVATQALVLAEIERQRARRGLALLVISHDLAVVSRLADEVAVLDRGHLLDRGSLTAVLAAPRHPVTRIPVAASPDPGSSPPASRHVVGHDCRDDVVLAVAQLSVAHRDRCGERLVVADAVSLELRAGKCLSLTGASGAGKTSIARAIAGLHPPENGAVRLDGDLLAPAVRDRTSAQRSGLQLVPQDTSSSLNPRRAVLATVARPLRRLHGLSPHAAISEARRLLERMRLPAELAERRPAQLSGGQRQRVAIARALAARPRVLICDEITSALDASVQATVLDLLDELRAELGLAVLLITHDLGIVARMADSVAVLHDGAIRERSVAKDVLRHPAPAVPPGRLAASLSLSRELSRRRGDRRPPDGA